MSVCEATKPNKNLIHKWDRDSMYLRRLFKHVIVMKLSISCRLEIAKQFYRSTFVFLYWMIESSENLSIIIEFLSWTTQSWILQIDPSCASRSSFPADVNWNTAKVCLCVVTSNERIFPRVIWRVLDHCATNFWRIVTNNLRKVTNILIRFSITAHVDIGCDWKVNFTVPRIDCIIKEWGNWLEGLTPWI